MYTGNSVELILRHERDTVTSNNYLSVMGKFKLDDRSVGYFDGFHSNLLTIVLPVAEHETQDLAQHEQNGPVYS